MLIMVLLIYCSTTRSTSTTPISDPSLPSLPEVVPLSLDVDVDVVMYVHEDMCPRPSCRGCCAPTIVSWRCRPEMPAGIVDIFCEMLVQVPREALEIAGTSINFRSGNFGYSICPFFSKGHAEFFREIWHDFAKNRTCGDVDVVLCLLSAGRCGYVFVVGRPEMPAT